MEVDELAVRQGWTRERCTLLAGTGATAVSASATNARVEHAGIRTVADGGRSVRVA